MITQAQVKTVKAILANNLRTQKEWALINTKVFDAISYALTQVAFKSDIKEIQAKANDFLTFVQ